MIDPKKAYWTQLSSLYAHLEQEEKSLAVMQLAYAQDYLVKNNDLRALAQLYLYHSLPYRAGLVLEKAREDGFVEEDAAYWEMLANSWLLAREFDRALGPLQTGAEVSEKGDLYARLGQLYLEREQWKDACEALDSAIEKGDLHDEFTTHLLLAISLLPPEAIPECDQASEGRAQERNGGGPQFCKPVDGVGRSRCADRDAQAAARARRPRERRQAESAPQPERATQPEEAAQVEQVSQAVAIARS